VAAGGAAVGLVVYFVVARTFRLWKDPELANVIWLLTPFAAFLPAEAIGASGVLAVVVSGVMLQRRTSLAIDAETRVKATDVFDVLDFVLNSLMFILIGMEVGRIIRTPQDVPLATMFRATLVATAAVVLARILWVFPTAYLPRLVPSIRRREVRPAVAGVTFLAWMGIRGGDSLVTALAIPRTTTAGDPFPSRDLIVAATFGVILATMLLQGLTLAPLIKLFKLPPDRSIDAELALARKRIWTAGDTWLTSVAASREIPELLVERMRGVLIRRTKIDVALGDEGEDRAKAEAYRALEMDLLCERRKAAVALRDESVIDDEVLRILERELDFEELRITREDEDEAAEAG
jgi:NhaP-type Na+/H+ or K+/H+ antiporter